MSNLTFAAAVDLHRTHLRAKRRAAATLRWYDYQLDHFVSWRQANTLPDVLPDADEIERFLADQHDRKPPLKPSTINGRYRALRGLFNFLEKRRRIPRDTNPFHILDQPSVPLEAPRHVTHGDLQRLLDACAGSSWLDVRDRLILHILFYSGLRVAELCDLSVHSIRTYERAILVQRGKGDKARLTPCPQETIDLFVRYLFVRPEHRDHLLLAATGHLNVGGSLTRAGIRQMLMRRCRQAGITPTYTPHQFRHGFAMWMLNGGARITTIAAAMGHSSPDITHKIYAHTTVVTVRREYDEALNRTAHDS